MFINFPIYNLPFLVICFFLPILTGWYIAVNVRDILSNLAFAAFVVAGFWAETFYLAIMYNEYAKRHDDNGKPRPLFEPKPRALANFNDDGMYQQTVTAVRYDAKKIFFSIVLGQLDNKFTPILTEDWWLRTKPRKWRGTDNEFRAFLHSLDGGALRKKNRRHNSPYIIRDADELRRIAQE